LIDNEGNTTQLLEKLRVSGGDFSKNLSEIIHSAYSNIFENIVLESAEPERIVNYMIEKYGYSQPLAEGATELFVYFCGKSNIAISQSLQDFGKKAGKPTEGKKSSKPEKVREKRSTSRNEPIEESQDSAVASLKSEEFSVTVKKDVAAINLAKLQINSFLDYWTKKLSANADNKPN
jgi:hypothetical protein